MPRCFPFPIFLDTDECSTVSPCHANATCNNTEGSYTCKCDSGYYGDGVSCNGRRFTRINTLIIDKILIIILIIKQFSVLFFIFKLCSYRRMFKSITL